MSASAEYFTRSHVAYVASLLYDGDMPTTQRPSTAHLDAAQRVADDIIAARQWDIVDAKDIAWYLDEEENLPQNVRDAAERILVAHFNF